MYEVAMEALFEAGVVDWLAVDMLQMAMKRHQLRRHSRAEAEAHSRFEAADEAVEVDVEARHRILSRPQRTSLNSRLLRSLLYLSRQATRIPRLLLKFTPAKATKSSIEAATTAVEKEQVKSPDTPAGDWAEEMATQIEEKKMES